MTPWQRRIRWGPFMRQFEKLPHPNPMPPVIRKETYEYAVFYGPVWSRANDFRIIEGMSYERA